LLSDRRPGEQQLLFARDLDNPALEIVKGIAGFVAFELKRSVEICRL